MQYHQHANTQSLGPYIAINTFTPAAGGIDALAEFQLAEMRDMATEAASYGWLGNEVYLSHDKTRLIVVTRFRSIEASQQWAATKRFQQHVAALEPLIKQVDSVPVRLLARHGDSPMTEDR